MTIKNNETATIPARDGIEAQRGLNDVFPGDPYPVSVDARRSEQLRIQAVGAAISRKDWHAVERAYNAIRDEFDKPLRQPIASDAGAVATWQYRMKWRGEFGGWQEIDIQIDEFRKRYATELEQHSMEVRPLYALTTSAGAGTRPVARPEMGKHLSNEQARLPENYSAPIDNRSTLEMIAGRDSAGAGTKVDQQ